MFVSEMRSRLSRLGGRSTISLVVCAACLAALPAAASAATVEPYPKPGDARQFAATDGGWTSTTGGTGACIAGVTCPAVTNSFNGSNGSSGASDGYLTTDEGGLLSAGILATSNGVWESPNFVYHGSAGYVPEVITYRMRRQANLDDFLAVAGTDATYRVDLINHSGGADVPVIATRGAAGPSAWTPETQVVLDPADLDIGSEYSVRITTVFQSPIAALPSGGVGYDAVALRAFRLPNTFIRSGPGRRTSDHTPTYGFRSDNRNSDFECSVDAAAFSPCASPFTLQELDTGMHTFAVRAVDRIGTDQTPATREFRVLR